MARARATGARLATVRYGSRRAMGCLGRAQATPCPSPSTPRSKGGIMTPEAVAANLVLKCPGKSEC
jgi:hypothetical protein